MKVLKLAVPLLSLLAALPAFADTVYNNTVNNGASNIDASAQTFYLGGGITTAMGLNFYAPTDGNTALSSFTLYLNGDGNPNELVDGVIATWNGSSAPTTLYTSSIPFRVQLGSNAITFSPTGLNLDSGGSYIAYLVVDQSSYSDFSQAVVWMPVVDQSNDNLPGGVNGNPQIQFLLDTNNYPSTYPTWDSVGLSTASGFDAAFQADFTSPSSQPVIPEPGTFLLLGTGLTAFAGALRSRLVS